MTRDDNPSAKIRLQGNVEGKRLHGRPKKQWIDNVREWTVKN